MNVCRSLYVALARYGVLLHPSVEFVLSDIDLLASRLESAKFAYMGAQGRLGYAEVGSSLLDGENIL